jgi:CcmD family protein
MTPDTFPSLFWSYTAVWAILALYIIGLGVRVAKLERTLSTSKETPRDGQAAA